MKKWTYSIGEKPNTVRCFERRAGGVLYLGYYNGRFERASLKHKDKARAKRQARELLAKLEVGDGHLAPDKRVTVADIVRLACSDLERLSPRVCQQYESHGILWTNYFGRDFDIRKLKGSHWAAFIADRRSGRINARGLPEPHSRLEPGSKGQRRTRRPVGERVIAGNLQWLRTACRIAVGVDLLESDPTANRPIPHNENPLRPVYSQPELDALLAVADKVHPYLGPLLKLGNETGRCFGAYSALRWSDIDLPAGMVTWPACTDKMGKAWTTPLSPIAKRVIEQVRLERPPFDANAYLFPHLRAEGKSVSRDEATRWLHRAESLANIKHMRGRAFHGFRRKAPTETKHLAAQDAAYLFGWKDVSMMQKAYQKATMDGLKTVIAERRQLEVAIQ